MKRSNLLGVSRNKESRSKRGLDLMKQGIKDKSMPFLAKAADSFMISEQWHDAADMYIKASSFSKHNDVRAVFHVKAAEASLKSGNSIRLFDIYKCAVSNYCETRMFHEAAVIQQKLAEHMEKENILDEASAAYQKASSLYQIKKNLSQSISSLIRSALISNDNQYAYETFEKVAKWYQLNNIAAFGTPYVYLCMGLSLLIIRSTSKSQFTEKLNELENRDPIFASSKEFIFLRKLGSIKFDIKDQNEAIHEFIDHVFFFDCAQNGGLDCWQLKMLKQLKSIIESAN